MRALRNSKAWAPPQTNSLDSLRVGPGVGCFSKAPQTFPGCGWGWGILLYRVLGWASYYKAVLFAFMSDYPSNPCCFKKKKSENPQSSKIIIFASWCVPSRLKKKKLMLKKYPMCPKARWFLILPKRRLKKKDWGPTWNI